MPSSRNRSWADTIFSVAALIAGTPQHSNLLLNAPVVDTLTVVRIIGDLWFHYDPASTIVDSLSLASLGIGVTSIEAFTIGGTSLPSPANDAQYPPRGWLYVNSQPVEQQAESTGVVNHMANFKFDVGAMRKIDKGRLFSTIANDNIVVGGAMRVVGRIRVLCLT